MARPIESTPILTGRSAKRFERLVDNCKYHPSPKRKINWQEIDKRLADELQQRNAGSKQDELTL
ncbi:MAG: hypothetical protein IKZ84_02400 [Victivallales bacterium]|nr:hypothetical protein [Victivallales bacterium]